MNLDKMFDISREEHFFNAPIDTASQYSVYEANDLVKGGNIIHQKNSKPVSGKALGGVIDAAEWLPFASSVYNISPNIKDYVIVPVEIIRSDMINRNGIAFPAEELLRFLPDMGMQTFKTWIGQPTHYEHDNQDIKKAKGVIISSALRKMEGVRGDWLKVLHLLAFDRTKDSKLTDRILRREITGYSMGSSCQTYTCSICGADMRDKGYCAHIDVRTKEKKANITVHGDRLAYPMSRYVKGWECSCVSHPAWKFASTPNLLVENW